MDPFKLTDSANDIATVLVNMFSPGKAQDIAWRILGKLKSRGAKAAKAGQASRPDEQGVELTLIAPPRRLAPLPLLAFR